jgi:lysophospholipase L1-like esterase
MAAQRVRRSRRRKNGSLVVALILVLIIALISFLGATIWQNLSDKAKEPDSDLSSSKPEESSEEVPEEQPAAEEPAEVEEPSVPEEPIDPEEPESPFEDLEDVVVPKGDWVKSEYFDDAMFVGDSITYGMKVYNTMTNATVIAHTGINPQTILNKAVIQEGEEMLTILQAMDRHNPGKIYIMLGANGVAFLAEEDMMGFYGEFIDSVTQQHPDAIVYVQSILPVTAEKSEDERYSNDRIDQYNISLMNLCKEKGVYYLNVAEAFKDELGNLPTEASPKDGMHFGSTYYMKWFDYLKCHAVATEN